ncbi:zinc ribbon domain-containing protein [Promineifilum sp.]|uniref:zinc ribbon domain-containing protein n=1 Tax=Promineifilum sp. TaxID=2664178 RepID=UPI0035AE71D5
MFLTDTLQTYLTVIVSVAGGLVLLLLLALVVWAYRDIRARSRSAAAAVLTVLVVAFLPLIGLVIYLLLRPRETLAEAYDRALEQEALLQQIEERPVCPTCSRPTQANWFLCPACHTHLRQPCPVCHSPLELHWDICPYCGNLMETEEVVESATPEAAPGEAAGI